MDSSANENVNDDQIDQIGTVTSSLCALHCLICALLPAAFGALGLGFLLSQNAELFLTVVAVVIALAAFVQGWKAKGSYLSLVFLAFGIVALLTSRVLEMGSHHHHDHHDEHHSVHHTEGHSTHHGEEHHDQAEHQDPHHNEEVHAHNEPNQGHHEEDLHHADEEEDLMHSVGALVGVLGGLFMFSGHLLNIRTRRQESKDCCNVE